MSQANGKKHLGLCWSITCSGLGLMAGVSEGAFVFLLAS